MFHYLIEPKEIVPLTALFYAYQNQPYRKEYLGDSDQSVVNEQLFIKALWGQDLFLFVIAELKANLILDLYMLTISIARLLFFFFKGCYLSIPFLPVMSFFLIDFLIRSLYSAYCEEKPFQMLLHGGSEAILEEVLIIGDFVDMLEV
jgi:hypothetical protein